MTSTTYNIASYKTGDELKEQHVKELDKLAWSRSTLDSPNCRTRDLHQVEKNSDCFSKAKERKYKELSRMKSSSLFLHLALAVTVTIPCCQAFLSQSNIASLQSQQPQHKLLSPISIIHPTSTAAKTFHGPYHRSMTSPTRHYLGLSNLPEPISQYVTSLFSAGGGVPLAQAFSINALGFCVLQKFLQKMLTAEGQLNALILGTSLWATLGWKGWSVCVTYLFLGVAVTKIRFNEKEKLGIAEKRGGKRGPENLWGSAATGLACAIASRQGSSFLGISPDLFLLAYVASLATKLADTFASEIGKAYGKTTFLITNLERVEPGTEGAISAEGTAAAVLGGFLLSLYGYALGMISVKGVAISTAAAFLATNAESLLGATVQEKKGLEWMTNEVINFINTLIGAGLALLGGMYLL